MPNGDMPPNRKSALVRLSVSDADRLATLHAASCAAPSAWSAPDFSRFLKLDTCIRFGFIIMVTNSLVKKSPVPQYTSIYMPRYLKILKFLNFDLAGIAIQHFELHCQEFASEISKPPPP